MGEGDQGDEPYETNSMILSDLTLVPLEMAERIILFVDLGGRECRAKSEWNTMLDAVRMFITAKLVGHRILLHFPGIVLRFKGGALTAGLVGGESDLLVHSEE